MSPQLLAWILSVVAASAFVGLGFVLGRRRSVAPVGQSRDAETAGPLRDRLASAVVRSAAAGSREDALRELLAALDGERGSVVLADAHGLPLAAHGEQDAEALAVLAGAAGTLMARIGEVLPDGVARGLDVSLGERTLRVRPLDADPEGPLVASLSRTPVSDTDFEPVRAELRRLIAGPRAGARSRADKQGEKPR